MLSAFQLEKPTDPAGSRGTKLIDAVWVVGRTGRRRAIARTI